MCGVALTPASSAYIGDNLLDTACRELAVSLSLEDPAVIRVGGDVRPKGSGEAFPEEDVSILASFSQIHSDLAGFEINIGDSEVAEFTHPHSREEEQPQHQSVLDILGTVHDLIKAAELVGGQNTRKTTTFLRRSKLADLPHPLCDVSPALIIEPLLPDQ